MPLLSRAFKKAAAPAPKPPAAPAPGRLSESKPRSLLSTFDIWRSPKSSALTCSAFAPFCGAKTHAAPSAPKSGLVTSHAAVTGTPNGSFGEIMCSISASVPPTGTKAFPFLSRNTNPSSVAIPAPKSLVALLGVAHEHTYARSGCNCRVGSVACERKSRA